MSGNGSAARRMKAAAVDPLKHSQPLGGALAFLGLNRCMPVFHGSQGCTAFAKALLVRHFREAVPLQTSALTEVTTVIGSGESLAAALATVARKHRPDVIGVLSTGLSETSGEDIAGTLKQCRASQTELADVPVVFASTPDFKGGLTEGYAAAVGQISTEFVEPCAAAPAQVNLLAGPGLSPLDVEEVRQTVEAFGLAPIVLPDLSASLDGHLDEDWTPLTSGGTSVAEMRGMGASVLTLAVGQSMEGAAKIIEARSGVPYRVYDRLSGLEAMDRFVSDLQDVSGRAAPQQVRRWRSRLADGLLDAHFCLTKRRFALALEPDLLCAVACVLTEVGAEVVAAVSPTPAPGLERLPSRNVIVGDLEDAEALAWFEGAEVLIGSSHARAAAGRLHVPLLRLGFPVFDRLGSAHLLTAGYRGSLDLIFRAANALLAEDDSEFYLPTPARAATAPASEGVPC